MTNELEKTFFDTFGIEQKRGVELTIDPTTDDNVMNEHYVCYGYPQITDRILLQLICIDNQENVYKCRSLVNNVEELKTYILEEFIRLYELGLFKRVHQVRTLFEES